MIEEEIIGVPAPGAGARADAGAGAGAGADWAQIVRACLSGSQPRHAEAEWLIPGQRGPIDAAQRRLLPRDPVPAAVLMPLIERAEPTMLFTQRAPQLRHHAGQISFPGGSIERGDESPAAAALREAREEIGLDGRFASVIGYLPDHLVVSGFRVTPVVALLRPGFDLTLDTKEVQDTFEVPVSYLFDARNHHRSRRRSAFTGEEAEFWDIPYGGRTIWGATAGMLLTLYWLCVPPRGSE